ncbi:MAG TPA: hypothetical protein VE860_28015 [Chthoniobacterales bacterium]|jgi:hypothetical protein|nr:hypothetical protein [Chthoniobacterales bacterium]
MSGGYAIGETDFECWGGLWKTSPGDIEVDGEEWANFLERIEEYFRRNYANFPDQFYFWGDFSGDRTLDMRIYNPAVLTAGLLSDLQNYLQINGDKLWRIRIPIYFKANDPHRVVVVYPEAIDIAPICRVADNCCCGSDVPRSERRSLSFGSLAVTTVPSPHLVRT